MITVRPEKEDDQSGIQETDAAATATLRLIYRPNQRALANKARISTRLQRLVAVIDGRIVGTVQYHVEKQAVNVIGLGVHKDFRRRGVARSLIQSLTEIGRREKAIRLQLHTVKQTGNVEIFERLRFSGIAERKDDFSESDRFDKLIDVEMIKKLTQ